MASVFLVCVRHCLQVRVLLLPQDPAAPSFLTRGVGRLIMLDWPSDNSIFVTGVWYRMLYTKGGIAEHTPRQESMIMAWNTHVDG